MRKRREIKRERIILYYILAIVLPCLMLGLLAFRGIKNDQALIEREIHDNLLETGQDILSQTDAYIATIENDFLNIIDTFSIPEQPIFEDSLLQKFISRNQAIAGIISTSGDGTKMLLKNELLYVPDNLAFSHDQFESKTSNQKFREVWQYEYREKNYEKAYEFYRLLFQEVKGKQLKGEVLNDIARIQKKLKLVDDAIETYHLIISKYPSVYIQGKIPLGAIALLEISSLNIKKLDSLSALANIQVLLDQIQRSEWEIGSSYYSFIVSEADKIISFCENSYNKEVRQLLQEISGIRDNISSLKARTEYLLLFFEKVELNLADLDPVSLIQRHKTKMNSESYFWSFFFLENVGKWDLLFDTKFLLENVIQPLIIEKSSESDFHWQILDENDGLLLKSGTEFNNKIPIYATFPPTLPSLKLKLYPKNTGILGSFFYSRGGLFLYIYVAILIILVFGLVFTLRTINNEIHFSKMKSYFMSTVSHEFKSPLTSIRQMAEMLAGGRVPSIQRKEKYYKMILQQSERLSHLIENILDFSKMEENRKIFNFQKDSLLSLVKAAIDSFQSNSEKPEIYISLSNGESIPDVLFDKEAMEQVMHNLLDNACKYSGDSKNIEVEIITKDQDVVVRIIDHGIGINKTDKDKIFDRFYRVGDELTQSVKGSGIGLTIVRQIVEAHNGSIVVESNPGKGSTFSVILPRT